MTWFLGCGFAPRSTSNTADLENPVTSTIFGAPMAGKCPESALAEYGARTLTDELDIKPGVHKPGYVKCLYKEINFLLEVTGITTELLVQHPNFAAVAALEGIVEGAKKNCGG